MKKPVVIIGIGELAGVFAKGFLRIGYPVYPILRDMDMAQQSLQIPEPQLVLVAVQENQLHSVLEQVPTCWRHNIGLLQNELLPKDWQVHSLSNITVTVVWFEKKKHMELTNILYSPSYGPNAKIISQVLTTLDIPAPVLDNEDDLLYELVRKAVYIYTVNIAGLVNNCTVLELWTQHQALAKEIAQEVIRVLEYRVGEALPVEKLITGMVEGIEDCPHRYCQGRRALSRLQRVLQYADEGGIKVSKTAEINRIVSS